MLVGRDGAPAILDDMKAALAAGVGGAVLVEGDTIRVWFGGGDVASPDENLHGQIGYGTLRPVSVTLQK